MLRIHAAGVSFSSACDCAKESLPERTRKEKHWLVCHMKLLAASPVAGFLLLCRSLFSSFCGIKARSCTFTSLPLPALRHSVMSTAASMLVRRCMAVSQVSCRAHNSPEVVQQLGVLTEQATCLDSCGEDRDRRTEAARGSATSAARMRSRVAVHKHHKL